MTDEEKAFNRIKEEVGNSAHLELLGAHPPSGKSYYSDLITFRPPKQQSTKTERDHVDLIFCSPNDIYMCEVKGRSSKSDQDIKKLDRILQYYEVDGVRNAIDKRLSWNSRNLDEASNVVKSIGCNTLDEVYKREEFLFIEAGRDSFEVIGHKSHSLKRLI
ncbi:hypothetical protein [Salinibacter ruber]|uniref:hypothetical protein n=1 Tax=Salinibacter ruber TaxID=146919 RepID=UPI0020742200|nr:hypothetical protein [Salinibacter ruber]